MMKLAKLLEELDSLNLSELDKVAKRCEKIRKDKSLYSHELRQCNDIWHIFYINLKGVEYAWDGAQVNHMKGILRKLKPHLNENDDIAFLFGQFISSIRDQWVLDNLSLSLVNSQFNKLMANAAKDVRDKTETSNLFDQYNAD